MFPYTEDETEVIKYSTDLRAESWVFKFHLFHGEAPYKQDENAGLRLSNSLGAGDLKRRWGRKATQGRVECA